MKRGYLVVEGHGDGQAALNLVVRLWEDLGLSPLHWSGPMRGKNLHQERGFQKVGEIVRAKRDAAALLLLRDEDDSCPKQAAPKAAAWLRRLQLPCPSAIVLAHREYEAFFLPSLVSLAGRDLVSPEGIVRKGLLPGTSFDGNPEAIRGVKEWLSRHMPPGRSYKPTLDQLPLTRMLDLQRLRTADPPLPCFGSLERALRFLSCEMAAGAFGTYPAHE